MRQTGLLETAKSLRKTALEGKIRCKIRFTLQTTFHIAKLGKQVYWKTQQNP